MRFDRDVLLQWLDPAPDAGRVAERLTACGFTVELREPDRGGEAWEVEITTNRPDAMNHRGLAREAAVACGVGLTSLEIRVQESGAPAAESVAVEIEAPELCSRYAARVIRGVHVGPSPAWLADRLERCGIRAVNNVVDATNYVLLELGHPLHPFDLERIGGARIVVRRAREGEVLETLDGIQRRLDPSVLVIADAGRPVALAGIMGGAASEISEGTTDVLLESAHFDPVTIRRAARRLGMHTEASHRFERGADPGAVRLAVDRAAQLIAELAGGEVAPGVVDLYPGRREPREVTFSLGRLERFAGMPIAGERALEILEGLGFAPRREGDAVRVTVPSWRVDVELPEDLYEEVIRHVGYDTVPAALPVLPTTPGSRARAWEVADRARAAAVAAGLEEVVTYAFIAPEDDAGAQGWPLCPGEPLPLENPLARTQGTMRRSLVPGLLRGVRGTLARGETDVRAFEQGRAFALRDGRPVEVERLALALAGSVGSWDRTAAVDFLDLKGVVEELLERLGTGAARWEPLECGWLAGGEAAVARDAEGAALAALGRVADAVAERLELRAPVYVAELDLERVGPERARAFVPLPRHPGIVADLTVEHDRELAFAELEGAVRELADELVREVRLVARYSGRNVPAGRVRTTLRLLYRASDRSLTQEEVNERQEALRAALAGRLGVTLV